jgi:hypothetical protein
MDKISFSYNWNCKLMCNFFTTIRSLNPKKYHKGMQHEVILKGDRIGIAEVVSVKAIYGRNINEYIAGLDTGYSVKDTLEILSKMYKCDVSVKQFSFVLYKFIERY